MVINIREPGQQDKARWLQLWEGYTEFYGSPQSQDVTEYTWQRMLDSASPVLGRVAVADGEVVGFAICVLHEGTWVKTPICYLEDLFVDPQMRGRGIARTLMQTLQREGKEKEWSRLYWHTRTDNPARRLYDEFTPADDYVRYRVTL
ncbi:GNAT family N-acetyltransferase [Klebsiella spallanzanii]|uniref:Aminoglycoside N(6')-acetyltransferase type 1 n=1 Tax=Klebsiella spallanzanii TaxID=2587528 RepID=A0A564J8S6_9ENTR|nr:GNAT family N-acetyltransferase [Klebsiella spallanzanii]VUS53275.1 Aminoglycoside N(6')-acetyltransferase type 1 [Klebsiella spallanzanii]